jgi:hypothetical protein
VLDAYTKAQDRERATLTDDDQRRMFGELADRRLATFNTQVERHAAAERQRWYDTASEHRIALMQSDAALHWNDDALLRRSLGTARAEVRDQAERKGWDSAQAEAALHHQTSRTLTSAIGAAVDRDPKRARELRTRYAASLEEHHRIALDALLSEAQIRERAQAASTEILNAAPRDGAQPTPHWRLQQAEAITDPSVRAATIRRLDSAAAADEARARALGEQVLARVLKDGLTDPSQIPVREWVTLDAERRQAIVARLDHNAAGTEPAPNPALVDELATQMAQAPYDFARRDLVPQVAHLPLPQWQRFRDWQAGLRHNDPTTVGVVYAIKRGFQIAQQTSPEADPARGSDTPTRSAADAQFRAALVEEINAVRNLNGNPPDDAALRDIVWRSLPVVPVHNTVMPHLDPETIRGIAKRMGPVLDAPSLFTPWLFVDGFLQQLQRVRRQSPPAPNIGTPPLDQETARRGARLPGQVLDELTLFMMWLFISGILQQSQLARPLSPPAQISPSDESDDDDDDSSEPSSDPAKPPSTKPSSTPPPPPPTVPPPPASTPGQQSQPGLPETPPSTSGTPSAPTTSPAPGTIPGGTIGGASSRGTNFRPFRPGGHHVIPKEVYRSLGLSDKALRVFERATTGPLKPGAHMNNRPHRVYSNVVAKIIDKWLKRKGITASNMSEAEANELLDYIMHHDHPVIREYLKYLKYSLL